MDSDRALCTHMTLDKAKRARPGQALVYIYLSLSHVHIYICKYDVVALVQSHMWLQLHPSQGNY